MSSCYEVAKSLIFTPKVLAVVQYTSAICYMIFITTLVFMSQHLSLMYVHVHNTFISDKTTKYCYLHFHRYTCIAEICSVEMPKYKGWIEKTWKQAIYRNGMCLLCYISKQWFLYMKYTYHKYKIHTKDLSLQ